MPKEYVINRNDPKLRTFRGLVQAFLGHPSPQILCGLAISGWLGRILFGHFGVRDLKAAGLLVAWWPLQEYLTHRFALHSATFGKSHADHHTNPNDLNGFVPLHLFCAAPPITLLIARLLVGDNWAVTFTVFATWWTLALNYEWTHYAIHAPHPMRTPWGKLLRKIHLFHHNWNENYWWGVSLPSWVDAVQFLVNGILPWRAKKKIKKSATVHALAL